MTVRKFNYLLDKLEEILSDSILIFYNGANLSITIEHTHRGYEVTYVMLDTEEGLGFTITMPIIDVTSVLDDFAIDLEQFTVVPLSMVEQAVHNYRSVQSGHIAQLGEGEKS